MSKAKKQLFAFSKSQRPGTMTSSPEEDIFNVIIYKFDRLTLHFYKARTNLTAHGSSVVNSECVYKKGASGPWPVGLSG